MNWLRENGGLIGLISVASVAVGIFAELRIRQHLDSMNVPSDTAIADIKEDVGKMETKHDADSAEWKRRVEKIVEILL